MMANYFMNNYILYIFFKISHEYLLRILSLFFILFYEFLFDSLNLIFFLIFVYNHIKIIKAYIFFY
jgi:hypothetical protein